MSMKTTAEVLKQAKLGMDKAMESTRREFASIRTGKATTALLDLIKVDAYGNLLPLNQVGSVAAPEARLLTVTPWDKGLVPAIEKAIRDSDLGLNPMAGTRPLSHGVTVSSRASGAATEPTWLSGSKLP